MCGISGIWSDSGSPEISCRLRAMTDALAHRGPDDHNYWEDAPSGVFLGHRRLSIIDLSKDAAQPMFGPEGKTCIVFNGEIYNYLELREDLKAWGYDFRTRGDTEVILALYARHGHDFANRLRGMFALAIWDAKRRMLIMARDMVGKKPLFYTCYQGMLLFSSEIKALKAALPADALELDPRGLDEYLSFGFIADPKTIYRNVYQLPPASLAIWRSPCKSEIRSFAAFSWKPRGLVKASEVLDKTESLLIESIKLRLRADVPVGVFLSGGIDSTLITALTSSALSTRVDTFSVGFEDSANDERSLARLVAERYGTRHHEIVIRPDIQDLLPRIVHTYDQPFADASAIPSYCIAKYSSEYLKVVLNGDGGDELFGGYRRHLAGAALQRLEKLQLTSLFSATGRFLLATLPLPATNRTPYAFAHRLLRCLSQGEDSPERYLVWFSDAFSLSEKTTLYSNAFCCNHDAHALEKALVNLSDLKALDRIMALDLNWYLPGDLLVKMDRATMAHGLEARSPFLDQDFIAFANTLPPEIKLPGITTKPLLRKIGRKYLPPEITNAPKRGFEIPLYQWLQGELRQLARDVILSPSGLITTVFRREQVERLLFRKDTIEPRRWMQMVWILLMLALWDVHCYRTAPSE